MTALALRIAGRALLAAGGVIASIAILEGLARGLSLARREPSFVPCECSYVYGFNPRARGINTSGLPGPEISASPGPNVTRILSLGDSVAYGQGVARSESFPTLLETRLDGSEVIQAATPGYSIYNSLALFREKLKELHPRTVYFTLCLNDVANPRLHWNYTWEPLKHIPEDAIPNIRYDREVAGPRVLARFGMLDRLLLVRLLRVRLDESRAAARVRSDLLKTVPTLLTAEDDLPITVLTDPHSTEFQWLKRKIVELATEIRANGMKFRIVLAPLSYQLRSGYPHIPQKLLMELCREERIPCLDLLNSFEGGTERELFLLTDSGQVDPWHFSKRGHAEAAEAVASWERSLDAE